MSAGIKLASLLGALAAVGGNTATATAAKQSKTDFLGDLKAAMESGPHGPVFHWMTATPGNLVRLRALCVVQDTTTHEEALKGIPTRFQAMEVFEKSGQVACAWAFSDRGVLNQYLDGLMTELDLMHLSRSIAKPFDESLRTQK